MRDHGCKIANETKLDADIQTLNKSFTVKSKDFIWLWATDHIVNNDKFFETFSSIENKFVRLPNNAMVKVVSVGTVRFSSSLVLKNDTLTWETIGLARLVNGLYELDVSGFNNVCNSVVCNSASKVVSVDTWHARLGHPSRQRMSCFSHMNKEISAVGFSDCDVCHLAKQKRLSFPLSVTKSECIFDLVHMDIWGPFPVESLYGHFYFLTVVDDKSRYIWIFPMKVKSEVRGLIIQFFAFVKTQFSKNIKCLRTDNGKEFDMVEFFKENGVVHQTSCIHTPQQNSVVERKHQHILSVARALRIQAGLPLKFWIDCVMHSAYLINITPTPVLDSRTPFELLFQTVPKVTHLRIFGCLSYASVLPRPETKMHPRSVKCIFLGFPKHSKGYRLFDISTHKVFISRDVVFSENIFPFKVAEKSVSLKEIVLPTCDTNGSLDDLDIGISYLNKGSNTRNSVTESVLHHRIVLQHGPVEQHQHLVEQQDLNTQVSDGSDALGPECSFHDSAASAGSSGSFSDTHQQQVVSKPLAQRSKSSRVAKLPQKFADFHVSLPNSGLRRGTSGSGSSSSAAAGGSRGARGRRARRGAAEPEPEYAEQVEEGDVQFDTGSYAVTHGEPSWEAAVQYSSVGDDTPGQLWRGQQPWSDVGGNFGNCYVPQFIVSQPQFDTQPVGVDYMTSVMATTSLSSPLVSTGVGGAGPSIFTTPRGMNVESEEDSDDEDSGDDGDGDRRDEGRVRNAPRRYDDTGSLHRQTLTQRRRGSRN
ncbi:hypothetical protein GQ457_15G011160 [Hibiscus cannabinus]